MTEREEALRRFPPAKAQMLVPMVGLRAYGPDTAARKFMDEMEKLYRSDHEEYQRRKKLIYQAKKERGRGKIKTYPDISLVDLRQILHELDMLYG